MSEKLKILTIDGGGTRGIIPATILHHMLKDFGKSVFEVFDLVAGTSTGGILATALAHGITTDELIKLYKEKSGDIFYDTIWDDVGDIGGLKGADYSNIRLKKILEGYFKSDTLGHIRSKINAGISNDVEAMKMLMVCAFDLKPEEPNGKKLSYRPRVFHSDFIRDVDENLVNLCLKTSAGPTYFPIYDGFVDGGVAMNNPAMAALAYAINSTDKDSELKEYRHPNGAKRGLGKAIKDIQLLSLGTGTSNMNYISDREIGNGDWGLWKWKNHIANMLTETNMKSSEYYVRNMLKDEQYRRLQIDFSEIDKQNVLYKDFILKNKAIDLDVKEKKYLDAMQKLALALYDEQKEDLKAFLAS